MASQRPQRQLDSSQLKAFENAAAGHDGVQTDESGELIIKPSTQQEVDFYQQTLADQPVFGELLPTFMGTLSLGAPMHGKDDIAIEAELTQDEKDTKLLHGKKITTGTAIVLENLESNFKHPNVLDLKLGAQLYAPGTPADKAERLDKVSVETTSGSLNFRIAGMKVWNGNSYDIYDKFYGRKFDAKNVSDGFNAFFAGLTSSGLRKDEAQGILETILADITKARHCLEKAESRMYGASVLVVYEGDPDALDTIMGGVPKTPRADEKAPTVGEVKRAEAEEEDEEDDPPIAFTVKMIDFAHARWAPGEGQDENVIKGLKNVEAQLDVLIGKFDE
ncbi:SAICAR synthase-like protein [Polychaeton citri CBS 116435]|uniref:Kinase n=1 Tax=Polychaeton citri CBS 116435 TaxID=1314669 RepID=A0A9P4QFP4_9PEZI|nr:SAICAR synthase-like protein [Polychaeton citri CBS 116435]